MVLRFYHTERGLLAIIFIIWIGDVIADSVNTQEGLSSSYFFYQRPEFPRDCSEVKSQCSTQSNNNGMYWIKRDGYPEPFEVFCDNMDNLNNSMWLIILRRLDGSVDFNRTWEEYQSGFGFLGTEFWLGNEKLSCLTNQKRYELRIDKVNSDGTSSYISYDMFRISDEWNGYLLFSLGSYNGTAESLVTLCPRNMEFGNCSCQATCEDPQKKNGCHDDNCISGTGCFCPDGFFLRGDDCVTRNECGCFVEQKGVIPNDGNYVNSNCSSRCTCSNDALTCDAYECDTNAVCEDRNGIRKCYCEDGFEGDGETCIRTTIARDCHDIYDAGNTVNGVYTIHPTGWSGSNFDVYCDMTTHEGGWTVFQRRADGNTNFYRNWTNYKMGFGNLSDEFWLGNDRLQKDYELRIDFTNMAGRTYYSLNSLFRIGSESNDYLVTDVGSHSGTAGHNRIGELRNMPFSTYDNDNEVSNYNCAEKHRGGWWYGYPGSRYYISGYCFKWREASRYYWCGASNLNGHYNGGHGENIFWVNLGGSHGDEYCNIKVIEMKIRPV